MSSFILKAQRFKGGFIGGMTATQVAGDTYSGYDKAGLFGGCFVNLPFHKKTGIKKDSIVIHTNDKKKIDTLFFDHWTVQMELDYIQKGSRKNPNENNNFTSYRLRLNYVEIPILVKYILSDKWAFEAGPAYGVLVHYKEETNYIPIIGKAFKKNALSAIIGVYYSITNRLKINIRTSNSILPVREHSSGAKRFFNRGQYNDDLCFSLHYQFR